MKKELINKIKPILALLVIAAMFGSLLRFVNADDENEREDNIHTNPTTGDKWDLSNDFKNTTNTQNTQNNGANALSVQQNSAVSSDVQALNDEVDRLTSDNSDLKTRLDKEKTINAAGQDKIDSLEKQVEILKQQVDMMKQSLGPKIDEKKLDEKLNKINSVNLTNATDDNENKGSDNPSKNSVINSITDQGNGPASNRGRGFFAKMLGWLGIIREV
jgi:predicted RNase H-like nuclease (RuvC/YqgF family)